MSNDYGVITEQGFAAGTGLGFTPVSEAEKDKLKDPFETKKEAE